VRGGAEAVKAEREVPITYTFGRHAVAAPADQACTEPRRDLGVIAGFTEREAIARIGDRVAGEAAVARIAGEQRRVAQVLLAAAAISALTAGRAEPGHADPPAHDKARDAGADGGDPADNLMARHDRQF